MGYSEVTFVDRTNYPLLSIVSIVAIAAVVAIFLNTHTDAGIRPVGESVSVVGNAIVDIGPLTGKVVSESVPHAAKTENKFDLTDDGALDSADAHVLGLVIDRVQFCPRGKQCDINYDGIVDTTDLSLLNGYILRDQLQQAPVAPSTITDDSASIGSYGAVA
jgi:hypothetical protein